MSMIFLKKQTNITICFLFLMLGITTATAETPKRNVNIVPNAMAPSYIEENIKFGCFFSNVFYSAGSEIKQNDKSKLCVKKKDKNVYFWVDAKDIRFYE